MFDSVQLPKLLSHFMYSVNFGVMLLLNFASHVIMVGL